MTKLKKQKQTKITKVFRKPPAPKKRPLSDEHQELQDEVVQLEQKLRERQNELFQLQRESLKHKLAPLKKREEPFVRPQKIILSNSVEHLKKSLALLGTLTGTEVQSYRAGEHCCVVYRMQHDAHHEVKHGLRILMKGKNTGEKEVSSSALPLGFNLRAVLDDFDSLMTPECLGAVRKALVAYHDRLEQYQALQNAVSGEVELVKTLDGSHMEISLCVHRDTDRHGTLADEEVDEMRVVVLLDFRVYDIRPKTFAIRDDSNIPEEAQEALRAQCSVFKKKPLVRAFKEAFVSGAGVYQLMRQLGPERAAPKPRPRKRRANPHQHNDDTFLPEDCSDQSDED